jgi:hypothetical protein
MLAFNWSLLNREFTNKCSEGLGFDYLYMQSPCNPLVEDYTEVFYMIRKGDVQKVEVTLRLFPPVRLGAELVEDHN